MNAILGRIAFEWVCRIPFPFPGSPLTPLPTTLFTFVALVVASSRDTLLELSVTLTLLSGAKSLRDSRVLQLLGKWVASSPLGKEEHLTQCVRSAEIQPSSPTKYP